MHLSRRGFISSIPALLLWLRGRTGSAWAGPRVVVINRFYVAGLSYYQAEAVLPLLVEGQALRLSPEPENPHDGFAVEIYGGDAKLGYVPRSDNRHISRLLRGGVSLACRVVKASPDSGPWRAVRVEVLLVP